ncbi:MAG: InlB B-repeat-containing protein [Bacteroidales bacterium]
MKKFFQLFTLASLVASTISFNACKKSDNNDNGDSNTTTYTVTFDVNKGSGVAPKAQTVDKGKAITLPSNEGMIAPNAKPNFLGWDTDPNASLAALAAKDSYTPTANVSLYAIWATASTYTITFDVNDGGGTPPAVQSLEKGKSINLPTQGAMTAPSNKPRFLGWTLDRTATTTALDPESVYTPSADVKLYALWGLPLVATLEHYMRKSVEECINALTVEGYLLDDEVEDETYQTKFYTKESPKGDYGSTYNLIFNKQTKQWFSLDYNIFFEPKVREAALHLFENWKQQVYEMNTSANYEGVLEIEKKVNTEVQTKEAYEGLFTPNKSSLFYTEITSIPNDGLTAIVSFSYRSYRTPFFCTAGIGFQKRDLPPVKK